MLSLLHHWLVGYLEAARFSDAPRTHPPLRVSVGKDEARGQLDSALQDVNMRYAVLEETEKRAVCRALIEERARYCSFVSMLKPVLVRRCWGSSRPAAHAPPEAHVLRSVCAGPRDQHAGGGDPPADHPRRPDQPDG